MSATDTQLPYNRRVLEWARVRTGMAVEEVAKKINVAAQKVSDWEAGKSKPTTRQGRMLADAYDRHFLEFFSENIPEISEVILVPDYRTFKGKDAPGSKEKRSMVAVQEWAEEQRLNALAIIEELGDHPPPFSLKTFGSASTQMLKPLLRLVEKRWASVLRIRPNSNDHFDIHSQKFCATR